MIEHGDDVKQLRPYDCNGTLLQEVAATGTETELGTAGYIPGVYLLTIMNSTGNLSSNQIIKQ